MSKRIRLRLGATLLGCALIAAALAPTARRADAQAPARRATKPAPQAATKPAPNASASAVALVTDAVLRETSDVRQLSVLKPVKSGTQSRAEIERMLVRDFDEQTTPEELRAGELSMKKLGLFPPDFHLRDFMISVLTEQILGYYDPKTKQFYLADWIDPQGQETVIEHELTHALQDQHFDLLRFEKPRKGESDADAAVHALVEGDATWSMTLYAMRDPRRVFAMMKSVGGASTAKIDAAPRALRETLTFPYEQGMIWVRQLYQRGGWKAVDDAFTNLPQSTEQIMHAEKYLAHEQPVKIDVPDLAPALGAGWRRIDSDVSGEFGYYLILDQFINDEKISRAAAAGWDGDRYALYENAQTHETALAQLTAWDTEADAQEFYDAYAKRTGLRYKTAPDAGDARADLIRITWHTPEGVVAIERQGARVAILEGLNAKVDMDKLTRLLIGAR
jgi:hypothetical protein